MNEGSQSATFKNLITGAYIFQFMVTDNNGLTGVAKVTVTVKPALTTTLTLVPANNPTEVNLGLLGSSDYTSRGTIEEPLCAWTINFVPVTLRNLLKFDFSSIPSNATIIKADLYLYSDTIPKNGDLVHANYGTNNSIVIQQVAASWDPTTTNWFNQPQGLAANQVIVPSATQPFLNLDVDVTQMVNSMVSSNVNYGFKLALQNEVLYTSRIFCSSYYSDATKHPKLVITYQKN